ncbi:MAG TPA: EF2563 family selenium-dependent molybdenum hydroxylase system protein [Clostridiaceae bacterium]|nr:EF2563 family selenium-dependent molybdenum hydroxylase system protein [Clostridiaceae bacterium]
MQHQTVVVRGAGDIATATIQKIWRAGFSVCALEIAAPSAIRRLAALSDAVYDGVKVVEDMRGVLCQNAAAAQDVMAAGDVAILVDPTCESLQALSPIALVDAILAKKNLGTKRDMAPITVALGPGFVAGQDVDAVVETMRGHHLGRLILQGSAISNTGIPGLIAGFAAERVIHSPVAGTVNTLRGIKDIVDAGERVAEIVTATGQIVPVPATIEGVIRGMIPDGFKVPEGFKIADIDARLEQVDFCDTISDKARCVGGGVLEAILYLLNKGCDS